MKYSIKLDTKPLEAALSKLQSNVSTETFRKAVLAGLFQLEAMAKINIKNKFKQHTGFLATNFETKIDRADNKGAIGHTSPLAVYARIQELGGVIKATNGFLVFKTDDGAWHKVKAVTLPARPYLRPAADEGQKDIVDAMVNQLQPAIEGK